MKPIVLSMLFLLSALNLYSQNSDWVYRNPLPQNDFFAIKFFDQNTGYVCGSGGVILKNTTGSNNWVTIQSNTNNNLYGMYWFDVNHGYIVGAGGMIMYTSDGGISWTNITTNNGYALRSITFLNANTGFICGDNGELYRTTTGITGWIPISVTSTNLHSVFAADSLRIYACGDSGKFLRSTNGGNNWTVQTIGTSSILGVYFTNLLTGFMANQSGSLKTTDGGNTWSSHNFGWGPYYAIKFVNANTGFAVGANGPIKKTTDAGANWNTWGSSQLFYANTFLDISPLDSATVFVSGSLGWILKSFDNGTTHSAQHLGGSRYPLSYISFINENTGEVIGNAQYLYTTNGGVNWTINLVGSNSWFEGSTNLIDAKLFAPASGYRTIYMPGVGGFPYYTLEKSTDAGLTWNSSFSTPGYGFGGYCESEGTAYLVSTGSILKNSGTGWTTVYTNTSYSIGQISFANANTGVVCRGGPVPGILRTTNGGTNWNFIPSGNTHNIWRINMLSTGVGYLAGDSSFIMKTYDYGANWTLLPANGNINIADIKFATDNIGWYMGYTGFNSTMKKLYYTPNGGVNFMQLQSLGNLNVGGFSFINANTGFVCGDSGVVLKTTNGGITFANTNNNSVPNSFSLSQNYPNPFNPSTTIKFDVPLNKGGDRGLSVKLIIYDLLGKEVSTLINEQLQPGSYSVDWDASNYPSGVYFYRLEAGDFSESKKMLMIK